jgi:phosphoribosylformimino-5-aminoimidazole carboxamide ribotide isomerase
VFSGGAVQWDRLAALEKSVGKKRLVLDLSCTKQAGRYVIVSDRWQTASGVELTENTMRRLAGSCDEFLVHAVDVEGKRQGIDAALVRLLADASPVPATYAGGIRSMEGFEEIRREGKNRVDATVGSALDIFGGSLKYSDVVAWHKKQATR